MLVSTLASVVATLVFIMAMLYVTVSDLRTKRIPNWLMIALAVAYLPLALAAGYAPEDMVFNLGAAAAVFAAGLYCFSRGWIGGGDACRLHLSAAGS